MTNEELAVKRALNGEAAVYDAHLSGYDVIVPVQIHEHERQSAIKHYIKPVFFAASIVLDMKLTST